jgi:hypothetical protein
VAGKKKAPKTAFKPGKSGNPGGRPKEFGDFRQRAREEGVEHAWKTLVDEMVKKGPRRIEAALAMLAYGIGKPDSVVKLTGGDGGPVKLETKAKVEHAPERLANIIGVLVRAGALHVTAGAGGSTPAPDAALEPVPVSSDGSGEREGGI